MRHCLRILFLLLLFSSCQTRDDPVKLLEDEEPSLATGAVTQVGTPTSPVVKASISQAGGSFSFSDSHIRATILSNALTYEQTISVQAVNNNCPDTTGQVFCMEPHGVKLTKLVWVTLNRRIHLFQV